MQDQILVVSDIVFCDNPGCNRNTRINFNHELLASCRTRKKYLKNSMSKNKLTFNF
jgi:hypothetical protein